MEEHRLYEFVVNKNTLKDWRTRTVPTVDNLQACLSVLGYELTFKPRKVM